MIRRAVFVRALVRALWFPLTLFIVVAINALGGVHFLRNNPETAPYYLSVKQDDSLIGTTEGKTVGRRGAFSRIFTQLFRVQEILRGAEIVVPASLQLNALHWRMFGLVELHEENRPPITEALERRLRRVDSAEPLGVGGKRVHVAGNLRPPFGAPLHLLAASNGVDLFLVSEEDLDRLSRGPR